MVVGCSKGYVPVMRLVLWINVIFFVAWLSFLADSFVLKAVSFDVSLLSVASQV